MPRWWPAFVVVALVVLLGLVVPLALWLTVW